MEPCSLAVTQQVYNFYENWQINMIYINLKSLSCGMSMDQCVSGLPVLSTCLLVSGIKNIWLGLGFMSNIKSCNLNSLVITKVKTESVIQPFSSRMR